MAFFCTAKEIINKTEIKPSEWEKIFANEATDKGLISKIYKWLVQLNLKKKVKDLNKQACPPKHTDSQQTHEGFSTSPIFREMQIKTTVRYHLIAVRTDIIIK